MQRIRDKSQVVFKDWSILETYHTGAIIQSSHGTASATILDRMTDIVTPSFKRDSRKGGIINSPMRKEDTVVSLLNPTFTIIGENAKYVESGPANADRAAACSIDPFKDSETAEKIDRLRARAITEAYAAVGASDVAVLTELVELKETIGFLMSPLKGMVNLTTKFRDHLKRVTSIEQSFQKRLAKYETRLAKHTASKRKNKGEPPARPEKPRLPVFSTGRFKGTDVASAWLAYRYGLMPLIYTFQDVEALLKKRAEGPKPRATARAKAKETIDLEDRSPPRVGTYDTGLFTAKNVRRGKLEVTVRAGVLYVPDFSLSRQIGAKLDRVPVALYEGIPLSFVTDWFHNGVAVYDALTAQLRALTILTAWSSVTITGHIESGLDLQPVSKLSTSGESLVGSATYNWKDRRPASLSDVRLLLDVDMGGKRVADALALVYSFLATARRK